jgi:ATP-dependent protease ClpP protease subunit
MHEIKIYGEIIPFEDDFGSGYTNLTSVQEQLSKAGGKDINVRIRSFGGDVQTGFDIYNELRRYAKDNNAKVHTLGEGFVASIATVFFLAGDKRTLTENTNPFVHNAWCYAVGDSKEILRTAVELESCNQRIAEHYALHTDLTKEEALELMSNETSITPEEAKSMRFATDIEEVLRPVALKRFNTNNNQKMNKKTETLLNKAMKFLKSFSNKTVSTGDGKELDFYELGEEDTIKVGDKAYYDGMDADGSFIMPNGETYVFIAGELQEIQSEEETDTDAEDKDEIIASLTEQLEAMTNKAIDLDTQNKAKDDTITGFKASSKPAPTVAKTPAAKQEKQEEGVGKTAVNSFLSNIKKKK